MLKKLKPKVVFDYWTIVLNEGNTPLEVIYSSSLSNTILFENGSDIEGGCINCLDKPCYQYDPQEIDINVLFGLPYNNDRRVCPADAINTLEEGGIAILAEKCIGCGICVQRCPTGGIKYNSDGVFTVEVLGPASAFERLTFQDIERQKTTMQKFDGISKKSNIQKITKIWSKYFRDKFNELACSQTDLEQILVRNFLLNLGIPNQISATGNNDIRFDFIGALGDFMLPGEAELAGNDILGLPRRILDDIAVLHSRYDIPKHKIIPLLVLFIFPRNRSDFYEVLTDIQAITGFDIRVLPLHFLFLLNLFNVKLDTEAILMNFIINKDIQDFGGYTKYFIPEIESVDENFGTDLYTFEK